MSNLNLNKYADRAAYNADTRPANENCVSMVGSEIIYDGVNVILKLNQLRRDDVCLVFWDTVESEYVFVPVETYAAATFDTTRFQMQNYVRFTRSMGRDVVMHKDAISGMCAEYNRYRLAVTTTAGGSFSWSVVINGTTKSGTVEWSSGATLDSIVTQLNQGAVSTYLVFSHESNESFIRITKGGYSNSIFTISNVNGGVTLTDLSMSCKIGGVTQERSHRDWQAQDTASLFPNSGFLPANSAQYARNGYNLSYWCGGNLARYKAYTEAGGSATYIAESTIGARMKPAAFAALNGSGVAEHQALYDKYNGSWDAYMEASMVKIDDEHTNGIEYQSYYDGDTQSQFLASVTTEDFDGSYIPAYPCAYAAFVKTATRSDLTFNMPTEHELAVFMSDDVFSRINMAMTILGGSALSNTDYYWSVARYNSNSAWCYYGSNGILDGGTLYRGLSSRALAYLN